MTLKLSMDHCVWEYYQGCTNYDRGLTLTLFTPRSNLVTKAFVCEKVKNIYCLDLLQPLVSKLLEAFSLMSLWSWVSIKDQGHYLTLVKGHSDFKVKTCFLKNSWAIFDQNLLESLRENRNENLYKWVVSWPTWLQCPYMVQNFKKSSPEPIDRWPWNFVCSIVYESTTEVVQIMTLDWSWTFLTPRSNLVT